MGLHVLVFVGVAAIVIVIPGPDTAVVTKNVLIHGRRAGMGTSLGVTVLKLLGAVYLVWLGIQALRAAGREPAEDSAVRPTGGPVMTARGGFRQGCLSDLANPKIGIFFTSLLPQFVTAGRPVLLPFLILGAIFVAMTVLWLTLYTIVAARAAQTLTRPRVRAALDRFTGVVLIAIGLRLAAEHR